MRSEYLAAQQDVAIGQLESYNTTYIRPLAVSPLTDLESVPTPWGFHIFGFTLMGAK